MSGAHVSITQTNTEAIDGDEITYVLSGPTTDGSLTLDGIDANGNCYIQGGLVYAIGTTSPEVAIDANSEEKKKLYVTGGTIVAIGGLESGVTVSSGTKIFDGACYTDATVSGGSSVSLSSYTGGGGGPGGGPGGPGGAGWHW